MEGSGSTGAQDAPAAYRELIRRRLATATRGLRWTYSIFWSFCPEQQVLVWGEGYLDGADSAEHSLRRCQQLRNLFNVAADVATRADAQPSSSARNPWTWSATLAMAAPGLSAMESFYVGSMALMLATGDGLPGRAFAGRGHVWHFISSEGDTRACLAQRARLQTIVCIPALNGVLEFGTTALVEQDLNLLQQMQSVFSEQPLHHLAMRTSSNTRVWHSGDDSPRILTKPHRQQQGQAGGSGAVGEMSSPATAFMTWETAIAAAAAAPPSKRHRQRMLKTALLTIPLLYAVKREAHAADLPPRATASSMQTFFDGGQHSRGSSGQSKHVMAERKRREGLNERFVTLRRLVPFVTKPNKVSVLGDAIEYVVELQRQVRELESTAKRTSSKKPVKQDVEVTVEKSMAIIQVSCAWQDGLLINILQKLADFQLDIVNANADVSDVTLNATLKAKVRGSDRGNEENKTAEIQAALLSVIEGKVQGKAVVR